MPSQHASALDPQRLQLPPLPPGHGGLELTYVILDGSLPTALKSHEFRLVSDAGFGHVVGRISTHQEEQELWIDSLWVRRTARKSGIGAYLLQTIASLGTTLRCTSLLAELEPFDGSTPENIKAFYFREGFRPRPREIVEPGEGEILERRVSPVG